MQLSAIGRTLDELDTPALLLDLDAFEHNADVMGEHFQARGVGWRPHAKAFKSPAIAHKLKRAGAFGVTVAKVSEAEVMAAGGIDEILVANIVVGPAKADRLAALQRQATVRATIDHADQLDALAASARKFGVEVGLLVDVNIGLNRTGVADAEAAVVLAGRVAEARGLRLDGLMGYEGHTLMIPDPEAKRSAIHGALGQLIAARDALRAAGLPCPIVSAGGSGSYQDAADVAGITEIQAGGGVFACMYYVEGCRVRGHRPALSVLATVISRPAPDRAILDIGLKSVSNHRQMPVLAGHPDCPITNLSAEHAIVSLAPGAGPKIGERVAVTPGYSDLTFVLHDRVLAHRGGRVEAAWDLLGRGRLQ